MESIVCLLESSFPVLLTVVFNETLLSGESHPRRAPPERCGRRFVPQL